MGNLRVDPKTVDAPDSAEFIRDSERRFTATRRAVDVLADDIEAVDERSASRHDVLAVRCVELEGSVRALRRAVCVLAAIVAFLSLSAWLYAYRDDTGPEGGVRINTTTGTVEVIE